MKMRNLLLSSLLIAGVTTQMTMAKEDVVKGTTVGFEHCMKPGAPIDITYKVTRVGLNEVADVNISLTTTLKSGEMEVSLDFDEDLQKIGEVYDKMTFSITPNEKDYKINLKVSSAKDGLYYVRLLTKIEGENGARMRAMAVPIYVGDGKLKKKSNQVIMKAMSGENLSISKAEETIEVIE